MHPISYCYNYAGQLLPCAMMAPSGSIGASTITLLGDPSSQPLPVTLIDFKAVKVEKTAVLSWSTTSELNSDRFDVQRSSDGKVWANIGTMPTLGQSSQLQQYSFIDPKPLNGENLYRLKMIDTDATFAYSTIQSLNFDKDGKIVLYPNPITIGQKLNISIDDLSKISSIKIFDTAGHLSIQSAASNEINTSGLTSGLYMVQITYTDGSISTHRVIKQ